MTYQASFVGLDKNESDLLGRFHFWRRHPDLNWGVRVLQTLALPLGYGAVFVEKHPRGMLFCGADYGARTRYLNLGKVALYQMS